MHHSEKKVVVAQVKVDGLWITLEEAIVKRNLWRKVHNYIRSYIGLTSFAPLFTLVQKQFGKRKFSGYVVSVDQNRKEKRKYLVVYDDRDKEDITIEELEENKLNVLATSGYDTSYWVFPQYLAKVYARVTKPYTLDAMEHVSGRTSKAGQFCSRTNSVFNHDLAGLVVWANPDFDVLSGFITHFLECYNRAPSFTSLMLVVPVWLDKAFWKLLRSFRVMDVFPKGTSLFVSPDRNSDYEELISKGPTRWTTLVLYLGCHHQSHRLWRASQGLTTVDSRRLAMVSGREYCLAGDALVDGPVIEDLVEKINKLGPLDVCI